MGSFRLGAALIALAPVLRSEESTMPIQSEIMPAPAGLVFTRARFVIKGDFAVGVTGGGDGRLESAVIRLRDRWTARMGLSFPRFALQEPGVATLVIECSGPGHRIPALGEDESYALEVTAVGATLRAATTVGALHGLETLAQLPGRDAGGWFLPGVRIHDAPRFPWRGLMIDVARHWQPLQVIERNLDCMALVKLNVLHLHLTDDQGFRMESKTHPELCAKGSDGEYFTQAEIRKIIGYAADRGIRVVPEFDIPGHATSWVVSHPELASLPGPYLIERHWGVFNPVLDPTNEAVYRLLDDFLGEMSELFPDPCVHIGGDENNGVQWNANPGIQAFIRTHGLKGNAGLHAYFNARVAAILARHGKSIVGWDEILAPGLPGDAVIQSWRGSESLAAAARLGYRCVLSNGYYIDLMHSARSHYLNDPLPASTGLTAAEQLRVLGGEATMWSEWVTPENIDSRIWPRTAAIAERLWSPREVGDVHDMYRRLDAIGDRLEEAGSLHAKGQVALALRLAGGDLDPADLHALQVFLGAIEPVKDYQRESLQPWSIQSTPLEGVADCAQPESRAARVFADGVDEYFAGPRASARGAAAGLLGQLDSWRESGLVVAGPMNGRSEALRDAAPLAQALADASAAGRDALEALEGGTERDEEWLRVQNVVLDRCSAPVSAAGLPMIETIRKLVAAAARGGGSK